jgi:radical SAM protein with 4Fe4S-binding SPASM domain
VGNKQISISEQASFDIQLYTKLINELKSKLLHVIFYFQGEPFLHRELNEMIQYAHKARIYTSTSTNGQFITDKIAKEIVISGLDKLIVSIDGSTQEIYETYRKGGKLSKAIEGIERIVACKKALKSATPMIVIQFLVLKTNEHQMKEMKQLAKLLMVDRLIFKTAQLSDFINGNDLLPTKNKFARYNIGKDGKYKIKGNQPNHCWRLWSGAVVNTKGEILPCCFDKNSEFSFGNIHNSSFTENWHNKKASDFRGRILQNRKQFEICRNCTE